MHVSTIANGSFWSNWAGFPDDENSWEPATVLVEDVPDLVKAFVRAHLANPDVRRMSEDLAIL